MAQPKLRFKREDGTEYPEWKEKSIGSLCEAIGDGLHKAPTYDINGNYYFINGNNLKNGKIFIEKETPKVSADTIQQSDKRLNSSTILMSINGTIGNLAYYYNENVMLGKSVAYLQVKSNVCKNYIFFSIQTNSIINKFKLSLTGTTIKNLGVNAIRETGIFIPCLEEQQKVADFLSTVDEVIAQSEVEVQNLEQQKKAAMQKIFSQEVRFRSEDGASYPDWRKDKWLNLGQFVSSGTLSKADLSEEGTPCILYGELYTKYGEIAHTIYSKTNSNSHTFSKKDDVILPKSGETPEDISTATCIPYDDVSLGGDLIVFRHNEKVIGTFLSYLISNRAKNAIASIAQGKSVVHISEKGLANIELSFPCLEEQQKIADFFYAYDEAITCAKQELDKWKELKKGLLQQMLV